ncbi:hypothetical protein JXB41_08490 [Candidatus Woesearchaeota archaeon]|nr:hypothetical protein [Candidatus Woesearchaeota archaeon]
MKHDFKVTLFLLILFISAQVIGLFILNQSIIVEEAIDEITGETSVVLDYKEVITGRPETQGASSFLYVFFAILIGTILLLILIKYKMHKVWKTWFFVAVGITLSIVFDVFFEEIISLILGFALAYLKIYRPNIFTHNLTEVFMYAGIALMIVPIFNIFWMIILLITISIYDIIAVFKSKHMIKLAKFQSSSKMFAGLVIPYKKLPQSSSEIKIHIPKGIKKQGVKSAILGGGDMAFPLLFAGVVMENLIVVNHMTKQLAFFKTLIIPVFACMALAVLLYLSKKNKFYPAMPFLTAGCLLGYGIIFFI